MNYMVDNHASIVACLNQMCHMLFWVALPVKLLGWEPRGHTGCANPLGVRLGVEVSLTHTFPKSCLNCICNQVLDLFDSY